LTMAPAGACVTPLPFPIFAGAPLGVMASMRQRDLVSGPSGDSYRPFWHTLGRWDYSGRHCVPQQRRYSYR
jgi:hypothetical protein